MPESGSLVGEIVSIADITVVAYFLQARYAEFEIDGVWYPKLHHYLARVISHEVIQNRMLVERDLVAALEG